MKYLNIFFILLILLVSCNKGSEINDYLPNQMIHVSFNDTKKQIDNLINKIDDVNLIPLEIDSTFILSGSPQMRVTSEHIYIFDRMMQEIHGFSKTGKYLFKINHHGRGPGEYVQASNFSLTNNSDISIYDQARGKILVFAKNGNFLNEKKIDCGADNVAFLNDSLYVAYAKNLTLFDKNKNCIRIINAKGETIKTFLNLPKWITNSSKIQATGSNFTYWKLSPILVIPWSNYIFSVSPDSVFCNYKVDFGNHNIPESFLVENESRIQNDRQGLIRQIFQNDWAFFLDFFQESSNYVFFQFIKNKDIYYTLFDKKEKEAFSAKFLSLPPEWGLIIKPFLCSNEDTFYSLVSVGQMNLFIQIKELSDLRLLKIQSQYKKYINNIEDDLNEEDQILLSFKMKS